MFFSGLFQRKSDAPVTTPAELADAIGLSYDTYTGKQISSQRAMRLTAVFSCVRVLAESVGMLPCKAHRTGAKFMMNNNSLFAIRLLKDTEGNYLWRPGLELGQPSSLAGYGIAENEQMPDIAADAKAIAFGNFKRGYTIVDRIGTRILRDPYTNKPFVGFYTTKRTGGMLVDSQAIKLLKVAAA